MRMRVSRTYIQNCKRSRYSLLAWTQVEPHDALGTPSLPMGTLRHLHISTPLEQSVGGVCVFAVCSQHTCNVLLYIGASMPPALRRQLYQALRSVCASQQTLEQT